VILKEEGKKVISNLIEWFHHITPKLDGTKIGGYNLFIFERRNKYIIYKRGEKREWRKVQEVLDPLK
jgi:hypothetical protein